MEISSQKELDDQNAKLQEIYTIGQHNGGFGKGRRDPPLHVWFDSVIDKDVAVA